MYTFSRPNHFLHKPSRFILMSFMMGFVIPLYFTFCIFAGLWKIFNIAFPVNMEPYLLVYGIFAAVSVFLTNSASLGRGIMDNQRRDYLESHKLKYQLTKDIFEEQQSLKDHPDADLPDFDNKAYQKAYQDMAEARAEFLAFVDYNNKNLGWISKKLMKCSHCS